MPQIAKIKHSILTPARQFPLPLPIQWIRTLMTITKMRFNHLSESILIKTTAINGIPTTTKGAIKDLITKVKSAKETEILTVTFATTHKIPMHPSTLS